MLELFILVSFASFFLIQIFIADEKTSHFGPFPSSTKKVQRPYRDSEGNIERLYEQPVTLIERLRSWTPLNPYMKIDNVWFVDQRRIEVWECPKCLTPWVTMAAIFPVIFINWQFVPLVWLAGMGGSFFLIWITGR